MSRWVLAAMILFAGSVAAPAQNQDGWAQKLFADKGKIVTSHDFGTVPLGAQLHHSFPMTNIYGVPLTVYLKTSCDCVKATASKQVIESSKTGTIEIDMDGRRFNGAKSVNVFVTVHYQDQKQTFSSTAVLNVSATARMDVTLNPGSVAFGIVPRGQAAQRFIDVDYAGTLDWQIVAVPKSDLFDITVKERVRVPGRIGYQIGLTLKTDAPQGTFAQDLALATNDPASPTVPIPFQLTVQPRLLVAPSTVKFSSMRMNSNYTANVLVQSAGGRFKITEIEGLGDGLELARPLPNEAKPVHLLALKLTASQPGPVSRKLTVKTDGDKDLTATVTIEGNVVQ